VSGRHQYRVKTRGDRRRDGRANDCLVCSPYYPPHDGWAAWIKGRCVDNAVGLDGRQRRCARQPEVQSKVDVLGGLPAMAAYGGRRRCAGGTCHLARQIGKMATSDTLIPRRVKNVNRWDLMEVCSL